eukprot:565449-Rhodomonas_salina.1
MMPLKFPTPNGHPGTRVPGSFQEFLGFLPRALSVYPGYPPGHHTDTGQLPRVDFPPGVPGYPGTVYPGTHQSYTGNHPGTNEQLGVGTVADGGYRDHRYPGNMVYSPLSASAGEF